MLVDEVNSKIEIYGKMLGYSDKVLEDAVILFEEGIQIDKIVFGGKKYGGIAAAALCIAGLANGEDVNYVEISEVIDEVLTTLTNRIRLFYGVYSDQIEDVTGLGLHTFRKEISRLTRKARHDMSKYEEIAKMINYAFFER